MSDQPAAGWYVDPTHRFDHRYWDGTTWTEHVSRNGQATTDPLDGSAPPSDVGSSTATADAAATDATASMEARTGAAPSWQTGGSPSWQTGDATSWQDRTPASARTNTKAILSLVASIVWVGGLGAVAGIILGTMAKREIRQRPDEGGAGIATAGIVIGILGVIVAALAFLALLAFFATGATADFSLGAG